MAPDDDDLGAIASALAAATTRDPGGAAAALPAATSADLRTAACALAQIGACRVADARAVQGDQADR
jgi:hypothetical protein